MRGELLCILGCLILYPSTSIYTTRLEQSNDENVQNISGDQMRGRTEAVRGRTPCHAVNNTHLVNPLVHQPFYLQSHLVLAGHRRF